MIKLQLFVIPIIFLCVMTTISSTSKYQRQVVIEKKNTQNAEVMLNPNPNQSKNEENFQDPPDAFKKVQNKTSKYTGVHKDNKKWRAQLAHEGKNYYGGLFDTEEHAAMKVNLLCDKYEKERKHPMINIDLDAIQKVQNKTSKYAGVYWNANAKKWQAQLKHGTETHYGGLFDTEEHAAMKVNLLCDKYEMERKNLMIKIEPDAIEKVKNKISKYAGITWSKTRKNWRVQFQHNKKQYFGGYFDNEEDAVMKVNLVKGLQNVENCTSKYIGVSWNKVCKKWKVQLKHKGKQHFGGYFDNEEHAAMKVNLFCDKYKIERKNPMTIIEPDKIQQIKNQTSKYTGVTWKKEHKCWQAQFQNNKKQYHGGYFDREEHAAMKVNLLCDKYEIKRKNPTINIESDLIQRAPGHTSIYTGVAWDKKEKKWQAKIMHKRKNYFGGFFDTEGHAAMKINLICDEIEIKRKNPEININGFQKFKDECENHFMQGNDEEKCVATEFKNSNTKRKRKPNLKMKVDVKEVKEENEPLGKIQQDYTKIQD